MKVRISPAPTVAILAVAAYLGCELFLLSGRLGFPLDDSWIHLTFARNLAAGHGLSYHPGEWVTGSTAPLWSAMLALGFLLPGAAFLIWPKLLGAACFVAVVIATSRLARELGCGSTGSTLCGVLVASSQWLVWSSLSGMEVHLFTALALWGLVWHLRERRRDHDRAARSIALLAAACLARPEGLLLLALALLDRALSITRARDAEGDELYTWRLAQDAVLARPLLIAAVVI
ncbi:MAG: hypothetical protein MI919_01635, partial [Holophagales bacterium]|nr:hypothetical protein [Holophagales bacterium]